MTSPLAVAPPPHKGGGLGRGSLNLKKMKTLLCASLAFVALDAIVPRSCQSKHPTRPQPPQHGVPADTLYTTADLPTLHIRPIKS